MKTKQSKTKPKKAEKITKIGKKGLEWVFHPYYQKMKSYHLS